MDSVHAGSKLQSNRLGPHSTRVYFVDAIHVRLAATWHSMRLTQLRKSPLCDCMQEGLAPQAAFAQLPNRCITHLCNARAQC